MAVQVADALEARIVDHALVPGTKLPTEPQLMEQYGVSRTVVREAGRILSERGLVDIRPRRGMTVVAGATDALIRQLTLLLRTTPTGTDDLFELRELVEPAIARMAAERRTDEDLARLRTSLDRLDSETEHLDDHLEADMAFHEALARATHNDFYLVVTLPTTVVLRDAYHSAFEQWLRYRHGARREHQAIYAAVEAGDADAAAEAAREHLVATRRRLRKLLAR